MQKTLPLVVVGLVCAVVGGLVGRTLFPPKPTIEVREQVKVVGVEKVESKIQELLAQVESVRRDYESFKASVYKERYLKERREDRTPDGAVSIYEREHRNIDSSVVEKETETEVKVVEVEKKTTVVEVKEVSKNVYVDREVLVKQDAPRWRVSALAGVDALNLSIPPAISYGARVDYRLLGPVSVGGWGVKTQNGALVGLSVGVDF